MNVSQLFTKIHLKKLIAVLILISISSTACQDSVKIYNFVDKQNYEIDLNYDQLLGHNMYFYSEDNLSLFIITIYPDVLALQIKMKLYTSDHILISAVYDNSPLFMGFDFNITNLDLQYANFQSDIFMCSFGKNNSNCVDYAINLEKDKYINNKNGNVINSKNLLNYLFISAVDNLIPLDFDSIQKILLEDNVISYLSFYQISFEKSYPTNFDKMTMLKWLGYTAISLKLNVTAFYGVYYTSFDQEFSLKDCYYSQTIIFRDGNGIGNKSSIISLSCFIIFFYLTIVFI